MDDGSGQWRAALKLMDTKELYGDDEREDMLNGLVKVTYTIRRAKGETHKAFFSPSENSVRKLGEHSITLPTEYLVFLLTVALQLSQEEVKFLLNFNKEGFPRKMSRSGSGFTRRTLTLVLLRPRPLPRGRRSPR